MDQVALDLTEVSLSYGDNNVLYDINLHIKAGQFVGIVGPSGCGKSSLFRLILGTDFPTAGTVLVDNKVVEGPNRNVGIVYQDYNETIPNHLTAEETVALGLKLDKSNIVDRLVSPLRWMKMRQDHLRQARELLDKLKLGHALKKYPSELSGGMKQRVAIAQALIMRPKVLLLDEPFSGLDESTREGLQQMLLLLYKENRDAIWKGQEPPHTILFITHELSEAFYCCDRVMGLSRVWTETNNGVTISGETMGATKVFDKAAPIHRPNEPKNIDRFLGLIGDVRKSVFNPITPPERFEHVTFDEKKQAIAEGVEDE